MTFRLIPVAAIWLLSATALPAAADEANVLLGNKYGELIYTRHDDMLGVPDASASVALLMTEDNNTLGHGTFATEVLPGALPRFTFDVGARLYLMNLVDPDDDVMGIGFGAGARFRAPVEWLPLFERYPLHLAASIYFAPEITTSGADIDVLDLHVIRGELELSPNIDGLVGLRTFEVDRAVGDDDIVDDRLYVGIRVRF
ncbi:MAG: hypothetical protein ACODAC_01585 [Pseudomonadota bacterium]